MTTLTIALDPKTESNLEVMKDFFGTKSSSAAVRATIVLMQAVFRLSKNKTVIVRDVVNGGYLHVHVE